MEATADDLKELRRLLGIGSTPYVEHLLKQEIEKLEQKFAADKQAQEAPVKVENAAAPEPVRRYTAISSYAFLDDKAAAKVIIKDIRGLEQAKIEFKPEERGFTICIIREEQNMPNLKLVVSPTKKIIPDQSKFTVRRETLTITLKKKKESTWMKLKKDMKFAKTKQEKEEEKENPNMALMNMMKKMYDEGDDEMKRTIAKAMWESQHKKDDEEKKD